MEIEAKLSFSDDAAFAAWRERTRLGPFTLARPRSIRVEDAYIDSADRAVMAAGYACRVRRHAGGATATLKSLADAQPEVGDGVRRREELEVELAAPAAATAAPAGDGLADSANASAPAWQQPAAWPESAARELALRLSAGQPLRHLTTIRQTRHERDMRDGERVVATLSLDEVRFDRGQPPMFELEVELAPAGSEADLAVIVGALRSEPGFMPATRSKLQRAMQALPPASISLRLLLNLGRDLPAARQLAALASALFDATPGLHGLPPERRALLELPALLGAAGREAGAEQPWAWAGDLLQAAPRPGVTAAERDLLLAVTALLALAVDGGRDEAKAAQRWLAAARQLPAFSALAAAAAQDALALAALLSAAEALARVCSEDAPVVAVTIAEECTLVAVCCGTQAAAKASAHAAAAWRAAFGARLELRLLAADGRGAPLGLRYDAPFAEAGRVVLRGQFARLLALCDELRAESSEDAVHDARVAARRMRTLLLLWRRAYARRDVNPVARGLKRLGKALGTLRDLDVLLAAAQHEQGAELGALLADWERRRSAARGRLQRHLASAEHAAWRERCLAFLASASASGRGRERLCDAAPALAWRRYGGARAAGSDLHGASLAEIHAARKELRRLRYLLEALRELLGKSGGRAVADLIAVQDALGALNDANVLRGLLEARLAGAAPDAAAVAAYLERTLAALAERRRAAEQAWPLVAGRRFRRRLGRALAAL